METLALGVNIDVTALARQLGFRAFVFIYPQVYLAFASLDGLTPNPNGDLLDMLQALRTAYTKVPLQDLPMCFQIGDIHLTAFCGALDFDDDRPAITVRMSNED